MFRSRTAPTCRRAISRSSRPSITSRGMFRWWGRATRMAWSALISASAGENRTEVSTPMTASAEAGWFANLRQRMLDHDLRGRGITNERVLEAMLHLPRHEFVPEAYRTQAYEDHPLPIGEEQTISQPYIVAIMLEALALQPTDTVLEVGTGSGYATALLAELTAQVVSVERSGLLAARATQTLSRLGYNNVNVIVGDGSLGFA